MPKQRKRRLTRAQIADAYGHELLDFLRFRKGHEIVERDDGLISLSKGGPRYFAPFSKWPRDERIAIGYARGRVLDIGCGAGRHLLYLQHRGQPVLGIDSSPLAIKVCRLRGARKARVMSIEHVAFPKDSFDSIIMMFNGFGLFGSPARAKRLLRRFRSFTSTNGSIIASSTNPFASHDPVHAAYHRLNRQRGRAPGQIRIRIRHQQHVGPWFDYLLVSPEEMARIVRGTGWHIAKYIKGTGGSYHAVLRRVRLA
jgi:SAM-dependent methyltransferase